RGMRDFYPAEMAVRNAIFDAWVRSARAFGFAQYDACVVESLDLLKRKSGEEIVAQIYAFKDKSNRKCGRSGPRRQKSRCGPPSLWDRNPACRAAPQNKRLPSS
ncbi:MAG: hypothetical protein L6437_00215, partial [Kiritimatiellae bacterium]|nr:hypothetical protein [Kiritimatiellia bacterium]